jgi:hypothetical protein
MAQEEEQEPGFVYATYMYCDQSKQWLADHVVEEHYKPVFDKAVEDGTIRAWGWLSHHTGGKWSRILYTSAPSMDALLDSQEAIGKMMREEAPMARATVASICASHDDYIWRGVAGSPPGQTRGKAGFSVYFICDMAGEDRINEIVEKHIGPIYDAHVGEGKLTSWGFQEHIVGGKYRRLATMTAKDVKTLMKTRGEIMQAMQEIDEEASEFSKICNSHADYIWEIQHEKP